MPASTPRLRPRRSRRAAEPPPRRGLVAVERSSCARRFGDLGLPRVEEEDEVRAGARAEPNASAAGARQRHARRAGRGARLGERHRVPCRRGCPGSSAGDALREHVAELLHARVRHRGQEEPRLAAVRVDHERRRRVVDRALHDRGRDAVGAPDALQLGERAGEEAPLVQHPVRLRVVPHPLHLRRLGVRADPEQLDVRRRRAEELLRLEQRGRRERADRRALRVVEARTTTLPRSERSETRFPNWSVSVNSGATALSARARIELRVRDRGRLRGRDRGRRRGSRSGRPRSRRRWRRRRRARAPDDPVQPAGHSASVSQRDASAVRSRAVAVSSSLSASGVRWNLTISSRTRSRRAASGTTSSRARATSPSGGAAPSARPALRSCSSCSPSSTRSRGHLPRPLLRDGARAHRGDRRGGERSRDARPRPARRPREPPPLRRARVARARRRRGRRACSRPPSSSRTRTGCGSRARRSRTSCPRARSRRSTRGGRRSRPGSRSTAASSRR